MTMMSKKAWTTSGWCCKMPDKPDKPPRGRPAIKWDGALLERLAALQCTHKEIAVGLGMSESTFYDLKRNDPEFLEILENGRGKGVTSLRSTLWQQSQKGSVAATIFLAKNYAGMSDKVEVAHTHTVDFAAIEASPDADKLLEAVANKQAIPAEYYITDGESK